ncbi:hypothetical protein EAP05_01520 [Salmonella enterica]|nr:hypothetical protein [Salmonella enterica]MLD54535.1 hypothetical protein [Salmonella enterica]
MVASKKITGDTDGSRCGCVRDISAFYASFHEKPFPGTLKPPVMAVAGFCSSGVVLSGWSVVALAGFGWRRMWWLCLAVSLLVRFRRIPSDSIKTIMIPAKQSRRQ